MLRSALLSASVLCGLAPQSFDAIAQDGLLEWKPGYRWKYRVVDLWKKSEIGTMEKEVTEVTPDGYRTSLRGAATRSFSDVVKPNASHVRAMPGTASRNSTFEYSPLRLPLQDGATWQYSDYWPSQYGGAAVKNDLKCIAKASERIKVPAGEYDTQRIECKGVWRSPSGWGGSTEEVYWYAPAVKWLVRQRYKSWMQGQLLVQEESELIELDIGSK